MSQETEEAAKVAKETVYGNSEKVNKVAQQKPRNRSILKNNITADKQKEGKPCYRCDRTNHTADDCRFKTATCNFCSKQGHIERACRKMKSSTKEKLINMIESTQTCTIGHQLEMVKLAEDVKLKRDNFTLELDTGACDNFISKSTWKRLGKPNLEPTRVNYKSASGHLIETIGKCKLTAQVDSQKEVTLPFVISAVQDLNLLGRTAIQQLGISIDDKLQQNLVSTITEN